MAREEIAECTLPLAVSANAVGKELEEKGGEQAVIGGLESETSEATIEPAHQLGVEIIEETSRRRRGPG